MVVAVQLIFGIVQGDVESVSGLVMIAFLCGVSRFMTRVVVEVSVANDESVGYSHSLMLIAESTSFVLWSLDPQIDRRDSTK